MNIDVPPEWFATEPQTDDIYTLDGWLTFTKNRNTYEPPPLLARPEYEALAPQRRAMYDMARKIGNNNLPKHDTPMATSVRAQVEKVLHSNLYRQDPGVRSGVFISADGAMGKSTLMRDIAADFEEQIRMYQGIFPKAVQHLDRWVPVIWVTVPPKLSIASLARAILAFYGQPTQGRISDPVLTSRVEKAIRACGTRLIVLDDITRYRDTQADQYAADWMRNLMESSASIVATGVDVRGSGILYDGQSGPRDQKLGTQTSRRFAVLDLEQFTYDTAQDIREWVAHLRAVEDDLLLLDKTPGMLSDLLPEFLFEQTQGVIGTLTDYIQLAATDAVGRSPKEGGEFLTEDDFLSIPLKGHKSDPLVQRAASRKTAAGRRKKGRNSMYDQPKNGAA